MNTRYAIAALIISLFAAPATHAQQQGQHAVTPATQRKTSLTFTIQRHEINARLDARPDVEAARVLAPFLPAVDSVQQPVLGHNDTEMWVKRPECPLGNWTADVLLQEARDMGIQADASVTNMGGLRASMPQGVVKMSHIFEIAPFDNRLAILTMPGTAMLQLCRQIASAGGEGVSGMSLSITHDRQLLDATIGGAKIDTTRTYTVATLDYLAEGNDRLTAFRSATHKQVYDRPVRDIYIDFIRRETKAHRTLHAQVEGRITVAGNGAHKAPAYTGSPTLTILHTNDTHSQIQPFGTHLTNKTVAGKGGYLRRSAFVNAQRAIDPELLLVDAGDFSQGTLFYSLFCGEAEVSLMNHMRYDAVGIGNHEFDNGLDNLARLARLARFPFVCANYDFTGTVCEGLIKPYIIIYRHGLKVGIFGLGCPLEGMVAEKNRKGVRYISPAEAADNVVDILHNREHCDLIICLSHLGWMDEAVCDQTFIPQSHDIDIIVGGHSHTYMEEPQWMSDRNGHTVLDLQMGKGGCYVGDIKVKFTPE